MNIVIIEDEKPIALDLANTLLEVEPTAQVVAQLHSVKQALAYFSSPHTIDLVFSDIQLGDGLTFEIFSKAPVTAPVIFCTAFNHYALDAFQAFGIDYVLKPFNKNTIAKSLEKFHRLRGIAREPDFSQMLASIKNQLQTIKPPAVLVHQGDKIIPIEGADIAFFYVSDREVRAHLFTGKQFVLPQQLDSLEKVFTGFFFRANRQFLINRKTVKEVAQHFNRKLVVNLTIPFAETILVGKEKTTSFLEWLRGV